jgi:hypothetical protein
MPRFAATILGLVLVAFSIGFNTVRYPVVWEMVNPAQANAAVPTTTVTQPAEPESPAPPAPVTPPPEPAKPIEVTPTPEVKATPDVTDKTVNGTVQASEGGTSDTDAAAKSEEAVEADLAARKPLVPVTVVSSPRFAGNVAVGGAGISRLPPVDQNDPNPATRNAQLSSGSIPIYPTTGIE